jgi:hypothetical protein
MMSATGRQCCYHALVYALAEACKAGAPDRNIIFLAVTAEESDSWVPVCFDNPIYPL